MEPPRWRASVMLVVAAFVVLILGTAAAFIVREYARTAILVVWTLAAGLILASVLVEVRVRGPASTRWVSLLRTLLVVIAFVAPVATTVALRLSFKVCSILNVFALPWPDSVISVVVPLCWAVTAVSTLALSAALLSPLLRQAAIVMWIYSAVAVVPGAAILFFSVFGDPAAGCAPV